MLRSSIPPRPLHHGVLTRRKRRHKSSADCLGEIFDDIDGVDFLVDSLPFSIFESQVPERRVVRAEVTRDHSRYGPPTCERKIRGVVFDPHRRYCDVFSLAGISLRQPGRSEGWNRGYCPCARTTPWDEMNRVRGSVSDGEIPHTETSSAMCLTAALCSGLLQ